MTCKHPPAEVPLRNWYAEASRATWGSPAAVKEAHRNASIREIFQRNLQEARAALRATLERAQHKGEVDPNLDLDIAVTVFMALGDGLLARVPLEPHMAPDRIEPGLRLLMRRMLQPASPQGEASQRVPAKRAPSARTRAAVSSEDKPEAAC